MRKQTFHFEIQDILTQFLAAFDNTIINRYDPGTRTSGQKVQVRYVYAPKSRVLYDLINPAQNITMPVVSVSLKSVSRDNERVFNKNAGILTPRLNQERHKEPITSYFRTPVPVNLSIDMSILTKTQMDMDQIISNFVPYANPYIIISWKIPQDFTPKFTQEIRTEVLWSGDISLNYPVEINNTQKTQLIADTSFTVKGWLFPYSDPVRNIYKVDVSLIAANVRANLNGSNYFNLSSLGVSVDEDQNICYNYSNTFSMTGWPVIEDVYIDS